MLFVSVLRSAFLFLLPLSIALSSYLYLYPIFHLCAFPSPNQDATSSYLETFRQHIPRLHDKSPLIAPFRLLALGDPQLEGDTSLNSNVLSFPNLSKFWKDALLLEGRKHGLLERIRLSLHDLVDFYFADIPGVIEYYRKRLDLFGNDYYLAHIYRTLHWWSNPTHVSVLGDLVGSQWISDAEFETRGQRYWNRVFQNGKRVEDELAFQPNGTQIEELPPLVLGEDADWNRRIINIAGNHDIGYAGDLTPERFSRFERVYGRANYELRFQLPEKNVSRLASENPVVDEWRDEEKARPELRIVVLNNMNLDSPVLSEPLQQQTYTFLNNIITTSKPVERPAHFTLILTHIPLYKPNGVCVDGPLFHYHYDPSLGSGIREQNHLSQDASKGFLEGLLGMSGDKTVDGGGKGRKGLIINGHDHEGCDVWHFINQTIDATESDVPAETESSHLDTDLEHIIISLALDPDSLSAPESTQEEQTTSPLSPSEPPTWKVLPHHTALSSSLPSAQNIPGTREITLRSMMGDFGGSAGLLSLWFDEEAWEWKYEFDTCAVGKQHIWWIVHVVDLIAVGVGLIWLVVAGVGRLSGSVAKGVSSTRVNGRGVNGKVGATEAMASDEVDKMGSINGDGKGSHALRKKKSRPSLRDAGLNGL